MLLCDQARKKPGKLEKIMCAKTDGPCGHVFFCELTGTYKQTRQADVCPVRKEKK